jgi:hypothetical protein
MCISARFLNRQQYDRGHEPKAGSMRKLSLTGNHNPRKQKAPLVAALASLVLAASCAAAPGPSVISTMTSTSLRGFLYDGARQWVTDAALGSCRIDGAQLTNCVKPAAASIPGQPAYSAVNHLAYVPDASTASRGIWRYALAARSLTVPARSTSRRRQAWAGSGRGPSQLAAGTACTPSP